MLFWWSEATQIRTIALWGIFGGDFIESDGFCAVFVVECNQNFFIIEINSIHECIDKRFPVAFHVRVDLAEPGQPEPNLIFAQPWPSDFFFGNPNLKFFLLGFQLFQTRFGGIGQHTRLDGVQHIFNAVLYLAHLLFQQRESGVFLILQLHHFRNDGINHGIVLNQLHGFSYDQIFQPLFTDGLFLAGLETLRGGALIIMMNDLVSTRTALAEHHRAAHSAEQLGGEQVIVLGLVAGRSAAVLLDFQLHFLKQVLVHDGRDAVGHHNVLEVVFSDVPFVRQQRLNTVVGELLVAVGGHATVVQPVHQFFHSCAIVVPLKGFYHKGSFQRVDLKELLLIHLKTNGNRAAVVLPLQNILGHAAHNFFRKFCRVVFSHAGEHTLDHDTRRAVRDRLRGRYQLDMISFQLVLIVGRIIAVSGKTVKLPDQHDVKQPFFAVLDHLLEIRAVVGFGGKGTVNVVFDHGNAVLFGVGRTLANLTFDGFFALVVAGIAGVDHGGHANTPFTSFSAGGAQGRMHCTAHEPPTPHPRPQCRTPSSYPPASAAALGYAPARFPPARSVPAGCSATGWLLQCGYTAP